MTTPGNLSDGSSEHDTEDADSIPNQSESSINIDANSFDGGSYDDDSEDWIMDELQRQIDEQLQADLDEQFDEYLLTEVDQQIEKQLDEQLQRELNDQYEKMLVSSLSYNDQKEEATLHILTDASLLAAQSLFPTRGSPATVANINAQIGKIAKQYENCTLDEHNDKKH
jgi:hypothetical protein